MLCLLPSFVEKKRRFQIKSHFFTSLVAILMALVFASGCSNRATATISPDADLNRLKTFYVVHQPKDTIISII
jgi:hypothetical protein